MSKRAVTTRIEDRDHERIASTTAYTGRTLNAEMNAAAVVYADLVDLVRVREGAASGTLDHPTARALERQLKDDLGRVLLAALPNDARSVFEEKAEVKYPTHGFGPVEVPFEKLIDWVVNGK